MWNPIWKDTILFWKSGAKKEEILNTRLEPENATDKFVLTVKKEGQIVTYVIFTQK